MPGTITPIGIGTAVPYPKQSSAGDPLDPFVDPGDTNAPIIFEPPPGLTAGANEVWIVATGGPDWGGCQVWVSSDGDTFALAGTVYRGGRQGVLTASLAAHADHDTVGTLSVDLGESQGQLMSGTLADADNFVTLCYCGGELLSYETATLTGPNRYDLTYLRRCLYGSTIASHASGAQFGRLGPNDPSLFRYIYPSSFIGQTVYLKLQSFNVFGQQLQSLSGLSSYGYSLLGTGSNPLDNPLLSGLAAGLAEDWGTLDTGVTNSADLAAVAVAVGLRINLGTVA